MASRPRLFFRPSETTVTKLSAVTLLPATRRAAHGRTRFLLSLPYANPSMPRASDPNRCLASECEPIGRALQFLSPADNRQPNKRSRPLAEPELTLDDATRSTRLVSEEDKNDIHSTYARWVANGRKKSDSPIPMLCEKYKVGPRYPEQLYNKVMKKGGVNNNFQNSGRPRVYGEETTELVVQAIRAARQKQRKAPVRAIARSIKKDTRGKLAPSRSTLQGLESCEQTFTLRV
jgi:hypothetical protein